MTIELTKILDDCIKQVMKGETIEDSLAKYPNMRERIEPLLRTALSISLIPKVQPSLEFTRMSRIRLMGLIRQQSIQTKTAKTDKRLPVPRDLNVVFHSLWRSYASARKFTIPITIALLLVLVAGLGQFIFFKPTPVMASTCILSILSGSVNIQNPGKDTDQKGFDGMTLNVGTQIKTGPDSHALLTFFEGSTVKLEPNTCLEIQQVEYSDEQPTTIILRQWLGRTWSRVIKMVDSGSRYEIETPSATAIVRGTLFTTEVEETGFTTVSTTEGLVSVVAQEQEVNVPANQKTEVEIGAEPSPPVTLASAKSEIIVTIDRPAFGSISDPTGSSTGILPTGLTFNQIQGSLSSAPSEDTQVITIAEPKTGEYIVTLRYITEGIVRFHIQGKSEGEVAFTYVGNWSAVKEGGWLIHLDVDVEEGVIVRGRITLVEPLGDKMPEKIVDGELYKKDIPPGKDKTDDDKDGPPGKDKTNDDKDDRDGPPDKDETDDDKDGPLGKDKTNDDKDDKKEGPTGKDKTDDDKGKKDQDEKKGQSNNNHQNNDQR